MRSPRPTVERSSCHHQMEVLKISFLGMVSRVVDRHDPSREDLRAGGTAPPVSALQSAGTHRSRWTRIEQCQLRQDRRRCSCSLMASAKDAWDWRASLMPAAAVGIRAHCWWSACACECLRREAQEDDDGPLVETARTPMLQLTPAEDGPRPLGLGVRVGLHVFVAQPSGHARSRLRPRELEQTDWIVSRQILGLLSGRSRSRSQ